VAPLSRRGKEITIGELADRSSTPASALRCYERQGLIRSRRTTGNQRRYDRDTLRVIAFIWASQRVGIPLAVIGKVLVLLPEGVTLRGCRTSPTSSTAAIRVVTRTRPHSVSVTDRYSFHGR
jgi:redox-sensitive transcriptional activator SoxR